MSSKDEIAKILEAKGLTLVKFDHHYYCGGAAQRFRLEYLESDGTLEFIITESAVGFYKRLEQLTGDQKLARMTKLKEICKE